MYDVFKLKAGNIELIWHGWYPPHVTIVNNTGEAWGASSAVKGNDGVSVPPLHLFLYFYFYIYTYLSLNSDWIKISKNKQKIDTLI